MKSIAFITDAEGNLEWFLRCVRLSPVLSLSDDESQLRLREDAMFVYGGNVADKANGGIRIAQMLLQLKRERPADVHIIAGTRDVTTLCRLRHDLTDSALAALPPLPPGGRGKSCREYLVDLVLQEGGAGSAADVSDDAVAAVNTKTNRLRWLLDCAVNAPGAFEFRRQEISLMSGQGADSVSDDDVLQSYISSVGDGDLAWLSAYMQAACLVFTADCTLFTHGGIYGYFEGDGSAECTSCIGVLPFANHGQHSPSISVSEWATSLNDWFRQQIEASAIVGDGDGDGLPLLSYASHPPACPSVLTIRMSRESGAPLPPPVDVTRTLNAAGITRIVAGGSAQGHGPSVWSTSCLEVCVADTDDTSKTAGACHFVTARGPLLHIGGNGGNGEFGFSTGGGADVAALGDGASGIDSLIGRACSNGMFVKSRLVPGGSSEQAIYELCKVQGQEFTYTTASRDETIALCGLEKLLKGGNTNLPLAASIKIQARAKGMLQRKKDRQRRADDKKQPHQQQQPQQQQQQQQQQPPQQQQQQPQSASESKQTTPRVAVATATAAPAVVEPPMSLESLPKGIHPSIVKLAKSVAEQRRAGAEAHKKAASIKAALQQAQQERLSMQSRAERAEEELRFFRAAESRSNSRASVGHGNVQAPSANDALAAMGAAHERAAVAEAELAALQAKAAKLQSDIASVRSETLDGFKAKLSDALAQVSAIEREVRVQNGEATAISRQMSEMGFNDFHISSALQYSVRELANKQKETDHLRAHVEALVRRLDAFASLESSRIHELQKLKGEVRDIAGGGAFFALDHLDRQLAAAGGGLFPSIAAGSVPESSRRGAGAGPSVAGKAKSTPGKINKR